jgi:hypothetical protein
MIKESSGDSTSFKKSYFQMEAILARRFSPFNFSSVPDFTNVVPTIDEWVDFFPDLENIEMKTLQSICLSFMNSCISGEYIMSMY